MTVAAAVGIVADAEVAARAVPGKYVWQESKQGLVEETCDFQSRLAYSHPCWGEPRRDKNWVALFADAAVAAACAGSVDDVVAVVVVDNEDGGGRFIMDADVETKGTLVDGFSGSIVFVID